MNDAADTFVIDHDPAKLLPFECWLAPEDETIERLPKQYQGRGGGLYAGTTVF